MPDNEEIRKEKMRKKRRAERRRKERQRALVARAVTLALLLVVLVAIIVVAIRISRKDTVPQDTVTDTVVTQAATPDTQNAQQNTQNTQSTAETTAIPEQPQQTAEVPQPVVTVPTTKEEALNLARFQAMQYDYDKAIATIQAFGGYESDADLMNEISSITAQRDACTAVDVSRTPHVFFHSLINDSRGLIASATCTEDRVSKNNKAMATVGEFNTMIQDMYEAGYVLISLDDLVVKTVNDDGSVSVTKNTNLYLPADKKPLIMSEDDLSYYHAYGENGAQGYADKLVLDENGQVKCLFTDVDGVQKIGDYDMVPLIDTFIREHPDFSYRGAKPTVALTGYNGVFGYRTNDYYKEGPDGADLNQAQKNFLLEHPEYDYDTDCAEARKIAEAMKANGWTFASHTYGHRNASESSAEALMNDHERWKIAVEQIVGPTDKIIFAFGADIGPVNGYTENNEKFMYFKSQGFTIFCNVDGNIGWTEFGNDYVRTGRVALDGVSMYNAMTPGTPSHETYAYDFEQLGIYDIASFFDPNRNTTYCLSES